MKTMLGKWAAAATISAMISAGALMAQEQQQQGTQIAPASAANSTATGQTYTNDQLVTLTVHQAWLMSGKNEANFFAMVTQLAELSAKNRNLELPETEAAGQKVGEMIKTQARKDTDQLLYAVVDAAVRKVGKPMASSGSGS